MPPGAGRCPSSPCAKPITSRSDAIRFADQSVENPRVGGSIPSPATIYYFYIKDLARSSIFRKVGLSYAGNVLVTPRAPVWGLEGARRPNPPLDGHVPLSDELHPLLDEGSTNGGALQASAQTHTDDAFGRPFRGFRRKTLTPSIVLPNGKARPGASLSIERPPALRPQRLVNASLDKLWLRLLTLLIT